MTLGYRRRLRAIAVASLILAAPPALHAQGTPRPLSLDEAMLLAEQRSEGVRIAQASVIRARGQQYQARSQFLPQLYGSATVTRTIQSQFKEISQRGMELLRSNPPADTLRPICTVNRPIPRGATQAEREAALQTSTTDGCGGGGLENSPIARIFAAQQTVTLGLQGSINLFTGGRVVASNRIAAAARRSAEIGLVSARAALALEVTQAYYDAALADRLATIADSSLLQSDRTLAQITVARNVGNTSEFELLRAQVTRDNQRPLTIQRRTQRDLAMLRLKQLVEVPASDSLVLTSTLSDSTLAPGGPADTRLVVQTTAPAPSAPGDTAADARASVRQLAELVTVQENAVRIARAQRIPSLVLSTQYGRTAYRTSGIPSLYDFFPNWTVTAQLQVPLLTGGRITGDEMVARANLIEARENHQQVKELAALDARSALAELEQAAAAWAASQGTAGQAARAFRIAEVRYEEGISTQLELSQSRLLLQEAEANRAHAARNLRVAQSRLALLRDLPLLGASQGGAQGNTQQRAGAASAAGFNQAPPQGRSASGAQTTTSATSFGGQQP